MLFRPGFSQNQTDICINEVMTINSNGPIDNFGHHVAWIEIFNSSYGSVNIANMYLTDDVNNPRKYQLPIDNRMVLSPRSYCLFYFDGNSEHGVFHSNFKLDSTGFIALYASNATTLIDSVSFSFSKADQTCARSIDGEGDWVVSDSYTPGQTNETESKIKTAELFVQYDPIGIGMAIVAFSVVMCALALLYFMFKLLSNLFQTKVTVKNKKESILAVSNQDDIQVLSGEINAAIALAIHLYRNEMHDHEEAVITIKKVTKTYSPWSSKLYMLRQTPNKPVQNPFKRK
jgi:hypothetical protein